MNFPRQHPGRGTRDHQLHLLGIQHSPGKPFPLRYQLDLVQKPMHRFLPAQLRVSPIILLQLETEFFHSDRGLPVIVQTQVNRPFDIALSADSKTVFTVSEDATLRAWDAQTGLERVRQNSSFGEALYSVACSTDGKLVAAGGKLMGLTLFNAATLEIITSSSSDWASLYHSLSACASVVVADVAVAWKAGRQSPW